MTSYFSATYPLDVGRSIKEVERIIKVLQRAKELTHLDDLDRARELSRYNEPSLLGEAERPNPLEEATKIIGASQEERSNTKTDWRISH